MVFLGEGGALLYERGIPVVPYVQESCADLHCFGRLTRTYLRMMVVEWRGGVKA